MTRSESTHHLSPWVLAGLGALVLGIGLHASAHGGNTMPTRANAVPGRTQPMTLPAQHFVFHTPLDAPLAPGHEHAMFGMGCFWGAEKTFFRARGVVSTAVGYAGGFTPNATYEEVCSGQTGHTEVVRVTFDPRVISYEQLLKLFWEGHDPTQGMRQGNDEGTQYRSALYTYGPAQARGARASAETYGRLLRAQGFGAITTEIRDAPPFYFAEGYHQQYLAKNPNGYCGHGGTGVSCPIGVRRPGAGSTI